MFFRSYPFALICVTLLQSINPIASTEVKAQSDTIFFADYTLQEIGKVNPVDQNRTLLYYSLCNPAGIDFDYSNNTMYWGDECAPVIRKSDFDGSNVEDVFFLDYNPLTEVIHYAFDVAVDSTAGKIYWSDNGKQKSIKRADLNGENREQLATTLNWSQGLELEPTLGRIYWVEYANPGLPRLHFANLDGSEPGLFYGGSSAYPSGLTIDNLNQRVYWSNGNEPIRSAHVEGGDDEYIYGGGSIAAMDFDETDQVLYFASFPSIGSSDVEIKKRDLEGNISTLISGLSGAARAGLAVNQSLHKLYFSEYLDDRIRFYDLEEKTFGSAVEPNIDARNIYSIAIDTIRRKVYWTSDDIYEGEIDNPSSESIKSLVYNVRTIAGLAIDESNHALYWTDWSGTIRKIDTTLEEGVRSENTEILAEFVVSWPLGFAIDAQNSKLYVLDGMTGEIKSLSTDGTDITTVADIGMNDPYGLAVDSKNGKIYWTERKTGLIRRMNLDGSQIETVVSSVVNPTTISISPNGNKIYWMELGTFSNGKVRRANLDGSNIEDVMTNGAITIYGLAILPDAEPPSVSISSEILSPTNVSPYPIKVDFNEDVQGLEISDFAVENGSISNLTGSGKSFSAEISPSGEGVVNVSLPGNSVTDLSGNGSATSEEFSFTYDSTAPATPVLTEPINNSTIKDQTPKIAGTAEAGVAIKVYDSGDMIGTTNADDNGNWSYTPDSDLAYGSHSFSATASDALGNVSDLSSKTEILLLNSVTVSFTTLSQSSLTESGTLTISAFIVNPCVAPITIPLSISTASTARRNVDYAISSLNILIPAGSTSGSVTLSIIEDSIDEVNEVIQVSMLPPVNASLGYRTTHYAKITDDDLSPTVSFTSTSQTLTEAGVLRRVRAKLSAVSSREIRVPFVTSGTATSSDYTISASPLVFPPGSTSRDITITFVGDTVAEPNETLYIKMQTPVNARRVAAYLHKVTIIDND